MFYLITSKGSTAGCPREPWHDLHSRLDGPAAYDVLTNFEERWLKASKPQGMKKLKKTVNDSLLKLERIPDIIGASHAASTSDNDPETWHVQVMRSLQIIEVALGTCLTSDGAGLSKSYIQTKKLQIKEVNY